MKKLSRVELRLSQRQKEQLEQMAGKDGISAFLRKLITKEQRKLK